MDWLFNHLTDLTDAATGGNVLVILVVTLLLLGGLGLPLPEDIPLLLAGYLCYKKLASLELMLPLTFAAVVGADSFIYLMGRRYGHLVSRVPLLKHHLSPDRLARAQARFHSHGGKTLFVARFLPGLRAPVFFTAGVFKIPFWKFLVFDGTAAVLSVPLWVLLAWHFGDEIDSVRHWASDAQAVILGTLVVVIASGLVWHFFFSQHAKEKAAAKAAGSTMPGSIAPAEPVAAGAPDRPSEPAPPPAIPTSAQPSRDIRP
ncbi:MAG: DedA family protein [Planctomycetota bacterium]|nr:DedA family protein [Planctomycetota bacterium]